MAGYAFDCLEKLTKTLDTQILKEYEPGVFKFTLPVELYITGLTSHLAKCELLYLFNRNPKQAITAMVSRVQICHLWYPVSCNRHGRVLNKAFMINNFSRIFL